MWSSGACEKVAKASPGSRATATATATREVADKKNAWTGGSKAAVIDDGGDFVKMGWLCRNDVGGNAVYAINHQQRCRA